MLCGIPQARNHQFDTRRSPTDKKTDSLTLAGASQEQKETF